MDLLKVLELFKSLFPCHFPLSLEVPGKVQTVELGHLLFIQLTLQQYPGSLALTASDDRADVPMSCTAFFLSLRCETQLPSWGFSSHFLGTLQ